MVERAMLRVICYDVAADHRRRKVADLLEQEAVRVQDSVFEARLTEREATALTRRLIGLMAPDDKLRVYAIDAGCIRRTLTHGGPPPEEQDFWLL